MVSIKRRIGILAALFALTLVIGMISNPDSRSAEVQGGALEAASLPVLCAEWNGSYINPLCGYTAPVCGQADARVLYPFVDKDLHMTLHLLDAGERPDEIRYELRSEDGSRLIDHGSAGRVIGRESDLRFEMELQDLLEEGKFYRLHFTVRLAEGDAEYYMRVAKLNSEKSAEDITAMTEYAASLHSAQFVRSEAAAYADKLETTDQSDKKTLAHVDIHSSFNQFAWGDAGIRKTSDSYMTIESYEEGYAYFSFRTLAEADWTENQTVSFRVHESMTLQRTSGRIYLLSYDRDTEQLWAAEDYLFQPGGIVLGMQPEESCSYAQSADGSVLAFTAAGELYIYRSGDQTLTRAFSFRTDTEHPLRTLCREYALKIMDVADDGTVEFILYGYMNGGLREGECGISYYSYDPKDNALSEKMYIASEKTFELLRENVNTLFCKGNDHFLYFYLDDQVFVMDFTSGETAVLVKAGESGSLIVNEDGTAFAWQSGSDQERPQSVRIVNLKQGTNESLEAEAGSFIRTLGYIREDIIVGRGAADIGLSDGRNIRPVMGGLEILNEKLEPILQYEYDHIYINGIRKEADMIRIERFGMTGDTYRYMDEDVMLRRDAAAPSGSSTGVFQHDSLMQLRLVPFTRLAAFLRINQEICANVTKTPTLALPASETDNAEKFYAYCRGSLAGTFRSVGEAIRTASAYYGYVVDGEGNEIWTWSNKAGSADITKGLSESAPAAGKAQELSGSSFRALCYFLDRAVPVLWYCPEKGTRWISGYNWNEALVYDPAENKTDKILQEELGELILRENNSLWIFTD